MTTESKSSSSFIVSFEAIFPTIVFEPEVNVEEFNQNLIDKVNDAYFSGNKVIIKSKQQKRNRDAIKLTLNDHGVLFNNLITKR